MPQQKGSTASVMIGFPATFGGVPSAGFILQVNPGENVQGSQAINSAQTMQGNRNPPQPFRGNRDVSGPVTAPVDSTCMPYWMTACFGDPTTTGVGPFVHEWKVPASQPPFVYEKGFKDLTTERHARHLGCKMDGFSINAGGDGELVMDFNVFGAEDAYEAAAFDLSPTALALTRLNNFNGAVEEGGASSSIITQVSLNVGLNLDKRAELIPIGNNGIRTELPESIISLDGSVTALFNDDGYTLLQKGVSGAKSSLKVTFTGSASSIFELEIQELEYGRSGIGLDTPEGLLLTLPFSGFFASGTEASAIVARITNDVASYDLVP